MIFDELAALPPDPILGAAVAFRADPSPHKVDLGIGVYKDEAGQAGVLACVKQAEQWLLATQQTKVYLSSAGSSEFNLEMQAMLFGARSAAVAAGRVATVQTPGGSGALRVAAEFLRRSKGSGTIWVPAPTWANHPNIMRAAGLQVREYPYYDPKSRRLLDEEMLAALRTVGEGDVVLLHGCCHNPAGADLTQAQWRSVAEVLSERRVVPLVDVAYQGFAEGIDQDAFGVRLLADVVPELLVANSCSKNFALYRERVGALSVLTQTSEQAQKAHTHLMSTVRTLYSMPPDHGAAIVAHILGTPALRELWQRELTDMRTRISGIRDRFAELLGAAGIGDFDYIRRQNGMFSFLDLNVAQVKELQREHHIYLASSGRINVAGLSQANVAYVSNAIARVLGAG